MLLHVLTLAAMASTEPTVSLVAPDGIVLQQRSLDISSDVGGLVERGVLQVTFENTERRNVEGRFEVVVPDGAAVHDVAMKVRGQWMEGVVVPEDQGREVYGRYLHRIKRDPILLEADSGNRWRARIFPVLAGGIVEVRIGWTTARAEPGDPEGATRAGSDTVARLVPVDAVQPDRPEHLEVLLDTSWSTVGNAARLEALLRTLQVLRVDVRVHGFDQGVELLYEGPSAKLRMSDLMARFPLGATDLQGALDTVAGADRVLLVTDGIDPTGAVPSADIDRLDVWVPEGHADRDAMRLLATGMVFDETDPDRVAERLSEAVHTVELGVPGAEWSWPRAARVQAGDLVVVHADLDSEHPLRVQVDGQPHRVGRLDSDPEALAELNAAARIASWTEEARLDLAVRERLVHLAVAHQLASEWTSWLVLETERELVQHGVARPQGEREVTANRGAVEVESTTRSQVLTRDFLDRIPQGRSYQAAVQMAAGVTGQGGNPNIAGGATNENTYILDGANVTDPVSGTFSLAWPGPNPNVDPRPPVEVAVPPPVAEPELALLPELQSLLGTGKLDEAEYRARAWARSAPRLAAPLLMLGEILRARGDHEQAARAFGAVAELVPERADLLVLAAQRLQWLDAGDPLAQRLIERAVELSPDSITYHALAINQARRHQLVEAVETLTLWQTLGGGSRDFALVSPLFSAETALLTRAIIESAAPEDRAALARRLDPLGVRRATRHTAVTTVVVANEGIGPRVLGSHGRFATSSIGFAGDARATPSRPVTVDHLAPSHAGTLLGHLDGMRLLDGELSFYDRPFVVDPYDRMTVPALPSPTLGRR